MNGMLRILRPFKGALSSFSEFHEKSETNAFLSAFVFFLLIGLYRFSLVLFLPGHGLPFWGDGVSVIGDIYSQYHGTEWVNKYWAMQAWLLGHVLSPVKTAVFFAFLAFVLTGAATFLLLRFLQASFGLALLGGVLMGQLNAFLERMTVHYPGLAALYFPVFAVYVALRAGREPYLGNLLLMAPSFWLMFIGNEYFGFYGSFFCVALFAASVLFFSPSSIIRWRLWASVGLSCLSLFALMSLTYPDLVFHRAMSLLVPNIKPAQVLDWGMDAFIRFSARPFPSLFVSSLATVRKFFHYQLIYWEFTYNIGILLPAAILLGMACLALRARRLGFVYWRYAAMLLLASWFMTLFALPPDALFSVEKWSYRAGPMFRVCVRAYAFADIGLVILFMLTADRIIRLFRNSRAALVAVGTIILAVLFDVSDYQLFTPFMPYKMPANAAYKQVALMPPGPLLELPLYTQSNKPVEMSYYYNYNRVDHHMPVVNLDKERFPIPAGFIDAVNSPSEETLLKLRDMGVRYIVAHFSEEPGYAALEKTVLDILARKPNLLFLATSADDQQKVTGILDGLGMSPWERAVLFEYVLDHGNTPHDFSYLSRSPSLALVADDGRRKVYAFLPNAD